MDTGGADSLQNINMVCTRSAVREYPVHRYGPAQYSLIGRLGECKWHTFSQIGILRGPGVVKQRELVEEHQQFAELAKRVSHVSGLEVSKIARSAGVKFMRVGYWVAWRIERYTCAKAGRSNPVPGSQSNVCLSERGKFLHQPTKYAPCSVCFRSIEGGIFWWNELTTGRTID